MNHPDPNTTPLPTHNPQPQFKLFQLFSSPESLVQVKRRPDQRPGRDPAIGSPEHASNRASKHRLEMSPGQAHGPIDLDAQTIELALASHAAAKAAKAALVGGGSPLRPAAATAAAAAAVAAAAVRGDIGSGSPLRAAADGDTFFDDDAEPLPSPIKPKPPASATPAVVSAMRAQSPHSHSTATRRIDVGARLSALPSMGSGLSVSELTALARELGVLPAAAAVACMDESCPGGVAVCAEQPSPSKAPAAALAMVQGPGTRVDAATTLGPGQAPEQACKADPAKVRNPAKAGNREKVRNLADTASPDGAEDDGDIDGPRTAVPVAAVAAPTMAGTEPAAPPTSHPDKPVATEAPRTRPSSTLTAEAVAALPIETTAVTGPGTAPAAPAAAAAAAASETVAIVGGDAASDESSDESTPDRTGAPGATPDAEASVADPAAKRRLDMTQEQSEAMAREAEHLRSAVKVAEVDANRAFLRLTRTNGELARVEKLLQEALLDRSKALDSVRELEIENTTLEDRAAVNRQTIVNQSEGNNLVRQLRHHFWTISRAFSAHPPHAVRVPGSP